MSLVHKKKKTVCVLMMMLWGFQRSTVRSKADRSVQWSDLEWTQTSQESVSGRVFICGSVDDLQSSLWSLESIRVSDLLFCVFVAVFWGGERWDVKGQHVRERCVTWRILSVLSHTEVKRPSSLTPLYLIFCFSSYCQPNLLGYIFSFSGSLPSKHA